MKRTFLLAFILLTGPAIFAQQPGSLNEEVKKTVGTLFQGMRKGDSAMVSSTFSKEIVMQTVVENKGKVDVRTGDPVGFLKLVGTPHSEVYDERITLTGYRLMVIWRMYGQATSSMLETNSATAV